MNTTDTSCLPVLSVCLCGLFHCSLWNTYNDTAIFEKYSFSALLGPFWPQNGVLGSQHWKLGKTKSKSKISTKKRCKSMYDTTLFDFFLGPFGPLLTLFRPQKGEKGLFSEKSVSASSYPLLSPNFIQKMRKNEWLNFHESLKNLILGPFWTLLAQKYLPPGALTGYSSHTPKIRFNDVIST